MKRAMTPKERRQRQRRQDADRPPKWKRQYKRAMKEHKQFAYGEKKRRKNRPEFKKAVAGKAGKKAPFVKPFMTAEDLMAYGGAHATFADTLNQLDFALESKRIESEYEKSNLAKAAVEGRSEANDDLAARGLFHSSVRDAELYDINATSALRQNYLDRQIDTAVIQTQTQKVAAQNAWDDFQRGMNQKQVENAQSVMTNTGKWLKEPVKAQAASGYKHKKIGPKPRKSQFRPDRPRGFQQGGGGAGPGGPGGRGGGHRPRHGSGSGGTRPPQSGGHGQHGGQH